MPVPSLQIDAERDLAVAAIDLALRDLHRRIIDKATLDAVRTELVNDSQQLFDLHTALEAANIQQISNSPEVQASIAALGAATASLNARARELPTATDIVVKVDSFIALGLEVKAAVAQFSD